jgi:hypothetical protein
MSRVFRWTLSIGLVLVAATLLVMVVAPTSPLATALVIAAAIPFMVLVPMIFASAWHTKGWSIRHPGRFDERTPLK